MQTITMFLIGTPWYIYVILVYLLIVGFKAIHGRSVSVIKLALLPILFMYMSIHELLHGHNSNGLAQLAIWSVSFVLGAFILGWLPYQKLGVKAADKPYCVYVPGNWFTLILISITFVIKYTIAVLIAIQYEFSMMGWYSLLCLSGFLTGSFAGRLAFAAYQIWAKPNSHHINNSTS